MRRWLRHTAVFATVFALTLASLAPADLALGMLLGGLVSVALHDRLRDDVPAGDPPGAWSRLAAAPGFIAAVASDVVAGTWDVALRALHVRPLDRPGIVAVPIGNRTPRGVAITALTFTLSPGTVLIGVDPERRMMLVHVIDASDPDAVRARLQRLYDCHQRRVFP